MMEDGISVVIKNKQDFIDFLSIVKPTLYDGELVKSDYLNAVATYPFFVCYEGNRFAWNPTTYWKTELTLAQFKKEQNIMKYSAGDVLENKSQTFTVEGVIGRVYIGINEDDEAEILTECEANIYTLKTETTKTDKTVAQIEKDLNLPAGSLNVVAE